MPRSRSLIVSCERSCWLNTRSGAEVVAFALLLLVSSGVSRVYVGENWPTDVMGGWLLGGACLIASVLIYRRWLGKT